LAAREHDPWQLAKAVHDYVADRVAYDVVSYRAGRYPPQDAETVFRSHLSVCAGYSALFEAIGRAAGLHDETIVGRARGIVREGMGEGHAWNAVQLDNQWYLVDTTWDAGSVDEDGFHKEYRTSYFLAPPSVFIPLHYPDEAHWQLLTPALSEGEYLRLPLMRPEFFAESLQLRAPDRGESDAFGTASVIIDNPRNRQIMVEAIAPGGIRSECEISGGSIVTAKCDLPQHIAYDVWVYSGEQGAFSLRGVGSVVVHSR
jgi:transglutaminase/protease-like cytokinesis protein 3